jgi:hypothetical protein
MSKIHFVDCTYDGEVEQVFKQVEETSLSRGELKKKFLADFFQLFFSNGRLGRQWEHKIIKPRFAGISQNRFSYNEVIKTMKGLNVIQLEEEKEGVKMFINADFKEDVVRFTKDGTMSKIISELMSSLP